MKAWSTFSFWSKHVVIAGITPCHFISSLHLISRGGMRCNRRQTRTTYGKKWRADGINRPTEKKFSSGRANASLAGAHAATGVQFRGAPGTVFAQTLVWDIFAAADQRVRAREIFQLGTQWERVLQDANKFLISCAFCEQMLGAIFPICRCVTGVHGDEVSIYANGNGFRHGPPQRFAGKADKAEWELRGAGREFARRLVLPWRDRKSTRLN